MYDAKDHSFQPCSLGTIEPDDFAPIVNRVRL